MELVFADAEADAAILVVCREAHLLVSRRGRSTHGTHGGPTSWAGPARPAHWSRRRTETAHRRRMDEWVRSSTNQAPGP